MQKLLIAAVAVATLGGCATSAPSKPNHLNSLSTFQTLVGSNVSSSGRLVCKYSLGATRILQSGQTVCPGTIN